MVETKPAEAQNLLVQYTQPDYLTNEMILQLNMTLASRPVIAHYNLHSQLMDAPEITYSTPFELKFYSLDCTTEQESYSYTVKSTAKEIEFNFTQGPDLDIMRSVELQAYRKLDNSTL